MTAPQRRVRTTTDWPSVSRLLAEALAGRPRRPATPAFAWHARPMRALIDVADKDALYAILDRSDRAAEP